MATVPMAIRMESSLKDEFDEVSRSIGLTSAAVVNVFARQFVAHRGFPFEVVEPVPSEREFARQMDAIYADMQAGNYTEHELVEV